MEHVNIYFAAYSSLSIVLFPVAVIEIRSRFREHGIEMKWSTNFIRQGLATWLYDFFFEAHVLNWKLRDKKISALLVSIHLYWLAGFVAVFTWLAVGAFSGA